MSPKPIYEYDRSFFREINTEAKAYFLGLMAADGWIKYDRGPRGAAISLVHDVEILGDFRRVLGHNPPPVRTYACRTSYGNNTTARLLLASAEMARDLIAKGFDARKSSTLGPLSPYVPQHLWPHLVRGFMDGNGGPVIETHSLANRMRLRWSLRGTLAILEDVQTMLPVPSGINTTQEHPKLYTSNQDEALVLTAWLYQDATVYMPRKRDKAYSALAQ